MGFDSNIPYNDLPLLPPSGVELETKAVLKQAIAANKMLAELKGAGDAIPNQAVLISGVVLQEAKDSSEIENIVTTNDELYQAAGDGLLAEASPHAKEVLYYREALWEGFKALSKRPLTVNTCIDIFRVIKQTNASVRNMPGTKISNGETVIYTPPEGEQVIRDKLSNLVAFIHAEDDLDALVKMAVVHYQFEAIHPFSDGNGRTGRILNILYLVEKQLLDIPVLYLSRYIIQHKADYYAGLRRVTEKGDWENWILYMLKAIEETAAQTKEKVFAIRSLMDEAQELAREKAGKAYSKDMVELIFEYPYCKIKFVEDRGIAKRQTASEYLKTFEAIGLLSSVKVGRELYYINKKLMDVLMS